MPPQPIAVISRKRVCDNAVFAVYLDHIRSDSGSEVTDYLSVEPLHRSAGKISGIAVLPVVDDQIGLIRIFRHPLGQSGWEIPRGFVDKNESPATAATRELTEETGLTITSGGLQSMGKLAPDPGLINGYILMYKALCHGSTVLPRAHEPGHGELRFFKTESIIDLVSRGEIIDPCTLVCCLKLLLSHEKPGAQN